MSTKINAFKVGQIEPTINDVYDKKKNEEKQERKALQEFPEDQNLVTRKTDKGNSLVLMDKNYYCNTLVMKNHLNTSTYQQVDSNSNKHVSYNL